MRYFLILGLVLLGLNGGLLIRNLVDGSTIGALINLIGVFFSFVPIVVGLRLGDQRFFENL